MDQSQFAFEQEPLRPGEDSAFVIDVDGFEGPLDLLLALARTQKVDLSRISILDLAEQYLTYVEAARSIRLELAADYLVMAAWLAYLKSRLLLPEPPREEGPSAADLAADLTERLRRLERIRAAAAHMATRDRIGHEVFARGAPEPLTRSGVPVFEATLYDLLAAYGAQRQRATLSQVRFAPRNVIALADARARLERLLGRLALGGEWARLDGFLINWIADPKMRATALASGFSATLEMVREGLIDVQQESAFAPIWIRTRLAGPGEPGTAGDGGSGEIGGEEA
ncbi:segregation and condensation protein A [Angulomicrobium tetraedrale]|uniref:Segregation and condensation protein A n=1 Tax=Ancylobacter tetraedralis TaxID=217068 RepID=A0A839Z718_9HYPH|nr:ScpA family protein [Ancylobacter tetraedralis]MBB3770410.1 segregation and condensation protein A [Ancylobacter tetraedralis]